MESSHPHNFSSDDDDTMAGVYNAWSKCKIRIYANTQLQIFTDRV